MNSHYSLVRAILEKASSYEWSLQGMGMLRLHLGDNRRLHIWDDRFRAPNVSMIHDHLQWGLQSEIIAGELRNIRYEELGSGGELYKFAVLKPGQGCYFKSEVMETRLREQTTEQYRPGDIYSQEPREIHRTEAANGTVTLMTKRPTGDESARVFWPVGSEWGSAEPRTATSYEVSSIVGYALGMWF